MKTLLVLFGIAALFLLLGLSRVTVFLRFREEFFCRVGYLMIHYTVYPRPPKKGGKEQEKEAKEKGKPAAQANASAGPLRMVRELLERRGLSGFLSVLQEGADALSGTAKRFFSHLRLNRFRLSISVGGDDAARTAVEYGAVCAAVGTAAGAILARVPCRDWSVRIDPDFSGNDSRVEFEMKAGIRLVFLLAAAVYALLRAGRISKELKGKVGA